MFVCSWVIDGRCIRKTKLTPFAESSKSKGGHKQNYDFQDGTGKIQACAFNDAARLMDRIIDVGMRFEISKAKVQTPFGGRVPAGFVNVELVLYSHSNVIFFILFCVYVGNLIISMCF